MKRFFVALAGFGLLAVVAQAAPEDTTGVKMKSVMLGDTMLTATLSGQFNLQSTVNVPQAAGSLEDPDKGNFNKASFDKRPDSKASWTAYLDVARFFLKADGMNQNSRITFGAQMRVNASSNVGIAVYNALEASWGTSTGGLSPRYNLGIDPMSANTKLGVQADRVAAYVGHPMLGRLYVGTELSAESLLGLDNDDNVGYDNVVEYFARNGRTYQFDPLEVADYTTGFVYQSPEFVKGLKIYVSRHNGGSFMTTGGFTQLGSAVNYNWMGISASSKDELKLFQDKFNHVTVDPFYSGAFAYTGNFGDFGLNVAGGITYAYVRSSTGKSNVSYHTKFHDVLTWEAGTQMTYRGFLLGGSFFDNGKSANPYKVVWKEGGNDYTANLRGDAGWGWNARVAYTLAGFGVGITAAQEYATPVTIKDLEAVGATPFPKRTGYSAPTTTATMFGVGASYAVVSGVKLYTSANFVNIAFSSASMKQSSTGPEIKVTNAESTVDQVYLVGLYVSF